MALNLPVCRAYLALYSVPSSITLWQFILEISDGNGQLSSDSRTIGTVPKAKTGMAVMLLNRQYVQE